MGKTSREDRDMSRSLGQTSGENTYGTLIPVTLMLILTIRPDHYLKTATKWQRVQTKDIGVSQWNTKSMAGTEINS